MRYLLDKMFQYELEPLLECTIKRRINRFIVLVEVNGAPRRARITNTGRLLELLVEGRKGYCIWKKTPKTDCILVGVDVGLRDRAALIDTKIQEEVFYTAAKKGVFKWLKNCDIVKKYPLFEDSRFDFMVKCGESLGFIEMKSAVLLFDKIYAGYPDCKSDRGRRHVEKLIKLRERGFRSIIVFAAAHPMAKAFKPYGEGDPLMPVLLKKARKFGVEIYAFKLALIPSQNLVEIEDSNLRVVLD